MAATALNPETSLNIWISTNKMDFSESLLEKMVLQKLRDNTYKNQI